MPDCRISPSRYIRYNPTNGLAITGWAVDVTAITPSAIETENIPGEVMDIVRTDGGAGTNRGTPGTWVTIAGVPDTGSTLSLMTLTLMALGVAARQFKRAAA